MERINLTQGQFALVDDEDFERLNQFKWCAHFNPCTNTFYADRCLGKDEESCNSSRTVKMGRFILGAKNVNIVMYKNKNTLDNRKQNLKLTLKTTHESKKNMKRFQNNKSGVTGVSWDKRRCKWIVYIGKIYLGGFDYIEDAIEVRKDAEIEHEYTNQ